MYFKNFFKEVFGELRCYLIPDSIFIPYFQMSGGTYKNWDHFNPILGIEIFLVNQWLKVWLQPMQYWCFHDLCMCNKATVKFSSLKQQAFYLFAYNVVIGLDVVGTVSFCIRLWPGLLNWRRRICFQDGLGDLLGSGAGCS